MYEGNGEPRYKGNGDPGYEGNGEPGYKGNGEPGYEGKGEPGYEGKGDTGTITEAASLGSFNIIQMGPSWKILDSSAVFWSLETRLDKA